MGSGLTGRMYVVTELINEGLISAKQAVELLSMAGYIDWSGSTSAEIVWGWGEHCWHTWKEYPLFTSVEIRCSKCGKLKEDDLEAEDAHKG